MFKSKKKLTLEDVLNRHYQNLTFILMLTTPEEGVYELYLKALSNAEEEPVVGYVVKGQDHILISSDQAYRETREAMDVLLKLKHEIKAMKESFLRFKQEPFTELLFTLDANHKFQIDFGYDTTDFSEEAIVNWAKELSSESM